MLERKSILVVDDEKYLRLSLSLILQKGGYEVGNAAMAAEALERLQSRSWDLMFLDLNMPGMSGIELLVEVHRLYPRMPTLILTAHATLETAIQAVRLGAVDYLIKPAEPESILARVAEIFLERGQPSRTLEIVKEMKTLLAELHTMEIPAGESPLLVNPMNSGVPRFLKTPPFEVDLIGRHVTMHGKYLPITGTYFDYFMVLLQNSPKAVSFKALVKEAQGFDVPLNEAKDLTRWRIHELRKLIEKDPKKPKYLLSVRGSGYRLSI